MATESSILNSLGISSPQVQQSIINGNTRLLILDAGAHLDWDWLLPFPVLVTGGHNNRARDFFKAPGTDPNGPGVGWTNLIFRSVVQLMSNPGYHYSVCEVGFLSALAETDPATFNSLVEYWKDNQRLSFTGGGITSPDNLLTNGEAFIRNYLTGQRWLADNFPGYTGSSACWIPDDFGQDPELPVILQAMGFMGAGFERIPGSEGSWKNPVTNLPSMATLLSTDNNKIDFTWTASDGSSIIAHWLIGGYGQGNSIVEKNDIQTYLDLNLLHSPTPYIYVPVLNDFSLPNSKLLSVINDWNNTSANIVAVCASFEEYVQLLQFHNTDLQTPYGLEFNPNPYYTGCYGTRPAIKILHQRATRNLLAAETLSIIAGWINNAGATGSTGTFNQVGSQQNALDEAWNLLGPSTHHDYITGTAIPDVYHTEQMTLLQQADARASLLLKQVMQSIAGAVDADFSNGTPVAVVFNPLGFERTGIAEMEYSDLRNGAIGPTGPGYQFTAGGGLLFRALVPSLGYQTIYLDDTVHPPPNPASVQPAVNPVTGPVILQNGLLTASLQQDNRGVWGLTSVVDVSTGIEIIKTGATAASLLFYADGGDEYRFGMEVEDNMNWVLTDVTGRITNNFIEIIESGPLRVVVRTTMVYKDETFNINYVTDYILHANEPMLRMRISGAAPMLPAGQDKFGKPLFGTSVVLSFPLAGTIDSLVRGTPYHWTDAMSLYWNQQTFLPTHNFIIPMSGLTALCAFYHSDMPAWALNNTWNSSINAFTNDGSLYVCAWRNGDGHYFNWVDNSATPLVDMGTDPAIHVHEFAVRVPGGLQSAASGQPFQESLSMASSLKAIPAAPWNGGLDLQASIASLSNPIATITTVKPGSVSQHDTIFRIYQPTNGSLQNQLNISSLLTFGQTGTVNARGVTALEQDLLPDQQSALGITAAPHSVRFTMNNAIATIAIKT